MSLAMAPGSMRQGVPEGTATIQKLLDENSQLICRIKELQTMGKAEETASHQQLLHRNLVFLAKAADQALLPQLMPENTAPPPSENVSMPPAQVHVQPQMNPQMMNPPPMNMSHNQMGMPMPQQHYSYPPQGMAPHGYPGQQTYDPQQQMPPSGPPMGYMGPR